MRDIYWVSNSETTRLAIVARPNGDHLLEADLVRMKQGGIDIVVSLLTPPEAEDLGLTDEGAIAEQFGMSFFSYPIPDRHVPHDAAAFQGFIAMLAGQIRNGRAVGIHCRGCIGRSTITAASLLTQLGWDARIALKEIEAARGCTVPDTQEQKAWILSLPSGYSTR